MRVGLGLVFLVGCARGVPAPEAHPDGGGASGADAPAGEDDAAAPPADAPPSGGGGATALLLTEIALAPAGGEYIEIANPTLSPVDLSTYYLADSGKYFQLAGAITVDANDFIVRFPPGSKIQARAVITVALDTTAAFTTAYGTPPTYALVGGTLTSVAANGTATLTNAGELVVLFQWDGQSDLVHDVDMMLTGVPTAANGLVDKSGVAIDGPDADAATTAYATDARTIAAQPTAPTSGATTKRIAVETGHETQGGSGNGIAGDDETSENTAATWDEVFTAPTPGTVPTVLLP